MNARTVLGGTGLLVALVFIAAPLQAQENRVGLVGGVTIATLGGDDVDGAESTLGFDAGLFVSWALNDTWALRPGLYYVQKGSEDSEAGVDFEFNLDYIEFPLLVEYRVPTQGTLGVHLFGGPAVAFEVGCEIEASDATSSVTVDCDDAIFEGALDTKAVDFGLMLGGGVDFAAGESMKIVIEGNYNLGLTSIDDSGADADIKNRAFQINAGVTFPIGR